MRVDQLVAKLQDRGVNCNTLTISSLRLSPMTRVALPHMNVPPLDGELTKGSAEFLILSLVEDRALHGYDIARLIDVRSKGALTFYAASLYPLPSLSGRKVAR
jgi:hypothetical protein